ncbi:MAG: guanylate cyclase [Comamonadaceae bacterium]|nr:MAG: guanylate cyclase [Comamonadaceae bacterium]
MSARHDVQDLQQVLLRQGLPAALQLLNERVTHRYTAVYWLDGRALHNLHLFDREGEARPEFLRVVPLQDSFCQFVLRDGSFCSEDSAQDARLDGHPYQGVMVSYHGVPLTDDSGQLCGTLCHFDVACHALDDGEFDYLQRAARMLAPFVVRERERAIAEH